MASRAGIVIRQDERVLRRAQWVPQVVSWTVRWPGLEAKQPRAAI